MQRLGQIGCPTNRTTTYKTDFVIIKHSSETRKQDFETFVNIRACIFRLIFKTIDMKYFSLIFLVALLSSCWKINIHSNSRYDLPKVWGNKPVFGAIDAAKKILYDPVKHPLINAGNIYAFNNTIFQVDVGRGIHVIDNTVPADAHRIGFITINGCEQVSISGSYLYTNSYADLVTIDISDPINMKIVNRIENAFPDMMMSYPLIEPEESGYYQCTGFRSDSVVVGWVKDSIPQGCYKN